MKSKLAIATLVAMSAAVVSMPGRAACYPPCEAGESCRKVPDRTAEYRCESKDAQPAVEGVTQYPDNVQGMPPRGDADRPNVDRPNIDRPIATPLPSSRPVATPRSGR